MRTRRDFVFSLVGAGTQSSYGQIEVFGFSDNGRVPADGFVAAVHIAVQAAGACFRAPVPEVPVDSCR